MLNPNAIRAVLSLFDEKNLSIQSLFVDKSTIKYLIRKQNQIEIYIRQSLTLFNIDETNE